MPDSQPSLREVPLASVWPPRRGLCYITLSSGQWDGLLRDAYGRGFVLLEVDDAERPARAYRTSLPVGLSPNGG
jgi:hypothetical protein